MSEAHLYMIQNLVNGRMYIGVAKNPQHRWKQNYNAYFKNDRAKCGAENFQHDVIASFETQELAYAAKAKISATHLGISKSETTKLRMSEAQQRRRSLEKEKPHGVPE